MSKTAAEEFGQAVQGTYSLEKILDLARRLIEEQGGLSGQDMYDLALLNDGSQAKEVVSGLNKIFNDYWERLGKKPPNLKPTR